MIETLVLLEILLIARADMSELLFCPLLVGQQEYKAIMVGHGDYVVPVLNPCIKDKCVAYNNDYCEHFKKSVYRESEEVNG